MCGRYNVTITAPELFEAFKALAADPDLPFTPRFNVAPTQRAPIIRHHEGARVVTMARWGLLPGWMKDRKGPPQINAQGETVAEKPMFRAAFKRNRCLVPATGFYEWRTEGKAKRPVHFQVKDHAPIAFAGLREAFTTDDGQVFESFAIITTQPNELVGTTHNRMPVILPREVYDAWLAPEAGKGELVALLGPYPQDRMTATALVDRLNKVANDDEACLAPA